MIFEILLQYLVNTFYQHTKSKWLLQNVGPAPSAIIQRVNDSFKMLAEILNEKINFAWYFFPKTHTF